jgi:tetratricopeptide (TPR) repeat protein
MSPLSTTPKGSDEFTAGVNSVFDVFAKNAKVMIAFAVVVLLGAGGAAVVMNHKAAETDQGRNALFTARKGLDEQLKKMAEASAPAAKTDAATKDVKDAKATQNSTQNSPKSPADKGQTKAPEISADAVMFDRFDVDAKLGSSVKEIEAVTQAYPNTRPAYEGMMVLGKLYLDHGQPEKAVTWFQKATENSSSLDKALAWSSVGYAQENLAQYKDAIAAYDKALNQGEPVIKGDLLMGKARSYQAIPDLAQARATYDLIISQLPNTEYSKTAESLKARLQ